MGSAEELVRRLSDKFALMTGGRQFILARLA
jgi:hypothetical protein